MPGDFFIIASPFSKGEPVPAAHATGFVVIAHVAGHLPGSMQSASATLTAHDGMRVCHGIHASATARCRQRQTGTANAACCLRVACSGVGGALWRQGFSVEDELRPPMVSRALAHKLLRAGKSLNFLR